MELENFSFIISYMLEKFFFVVFVFIIFFLKYCGDDQVRLYI